MTHHLTHLQVADVSVLVSTAGARMPQIRYWGPSLGELAESDLAAISLADQFPATIGELDERYHVALLPEHSWGWMHTPGLAGSRAGLDHSTQFQLVATDQVDSENGVRFIATGVDEVAALELKVKLELLASGLLRAQAQVTSLGAGSSEAPYTIEALNLMFPVPSSVTEILDFHGKWIKERTPQRTPFNVGTHLRESRRGKPGHDSAFLLAAGQAGFGFRSGDVYMTHVAWSGNSRSLAERNNYGARLIGGGELLYPGEVQLFPGDSYRSPWVYASFGTGLDACSARFHQYLRSRPQHPTRPRPVIVNTWEAVYFDHDQAKLKALAEAAVKVGAERFVLDDGWFRHRRQDNAGLGDWYVDDEVYPQGLKPLADYVRGLGLEFGLWVEPEMINPDSDLARQHPEWIAQPELAQRRSQLGGTSRLPIRARAQQVLDLTHPAAYAYIEERLHSLVAELAPTYLKWDHNRDLLEAGNSTSGKPIGHAQTEAYYRLLDGLRQSFPGLEIESCAGGGGRIDIEVLEHTDRVWTSDCNDPLERQNMQLYTSLLVPPELMGTHIGPPIAHTTHRTSSLDFRGGTAIWGHLGIEWNVAGAEVQTPEIQAALKSWVELYRTYRGLLHSGTVVRCDLPHTGHVAQGVVGTDQGEALFSYANLGNHIEAPVGRWQLPGLAADRTYLVEPIGALELPSSGLRAAPPWWQTAKAGTQVRMTGRALAEFGLQTPALAPQEVALIRVIAD